MLMRALALVLLWLVTPALGRDDGRWATSPLKPWFESLKSRIGAVCCAEADGLRDPEWRRRHDGGYSVRIDGRWYEVPESAVVDAANRVGYPMVWPVPQVIPDSAGGATVTYTIRCFMPGTEVSRCRNKSLLGCAQGV